MLSIRITILEGGKGQTLKSVLPTELVTMSLLRMRLVDDGVLYWLKIPIGLDMTKVSTTVVVVVVVVVVIVVIVVVVLIFLLTIYADHDFFYLIVCNRYASQLKMRKLLNIEVLWGMLGIFCFLY